MPVVVRGLRELQVLFAKGPKEAKRELNQELRMVAEPTRADAEAFAMSGIRRVGPTWSRMRVGVTRQLVYVAPKQRGVGRGRDPRSRPKFGTLLEQRAMTPALRKNESMIEGRVETLFENLCRKWTNE